MSLTVRPPGGPLNDLFHGSEHGNRDVGLCSSVQVVRSAWKHHAPVTVTYRSAVFATRVCLVTPFRSWAMNQRTRDGLPHPTRDPITGYTRVPYRHRSPFSARELDHVEIPCESK